MVLTKSKAILLAAALILAAVCMGAAALQREQMALAEKLIRLHVVANSDSEADQAVKLQVRDAVLAVTQPLTAGEDPYGALAGALPEILPCIGCTQPSRWHCYDVWQHTAVAVGAVEAHALAQTLTGHGDARGARVLRWAALLHDLGKPACRTEDADGTAHFPGHNQRGGRMAREILLRLRAPASLTKGAAALVAVHDAPLPAADADILRLLHRRGAVFLRRLCQLKLADLAAHAQNAAVTARWQEVTQFAARMETLAADGCYRLDRLAVNGGDVLAAGLRPGPAVGQALDILLNAVMDGTLPNERTALLAALQRGFL